MRQILSGREARIDCNEPQSARMYLSCNHEMYSMCYAQLFRKIAVALCLLPTAAVAAGQNDEPKLPTVTAVWRVHELQFNFRSPRSYSCEGLKNKIAGILKAVGAHESAEIRLPCRDGTLLNSALVIINLAAPVEATPENVTAVTTYSAQQLLIARLYNMKLPSATDVERFNAEWRSVALHNYRGLRLEAGDCELLQDLSVQIFPQLGVRPEPQRLTCPSAADMRSKPKMQVTALIAAPREPDAGVTKEQGAR